MLFRLPYPFFLHSFIISINRSIILFPCLSSLRLCFNLRSFEIFYTLLIYWRLYAYQIFTFLIMLFLFATRLNSLLIKSHPSNKINLNAYTLFTTYIILILSVSISIEIPLANFTKFDFSYPLSLLFLLPYLINRPNKSKSSVLLLLTTLVLSFATSNMYFIICHVLLCSFLIFSIASHTPSVYTIYAIPIH